MPSPSPYYLDPQIGQISSNLATAIYGDPEARMKGQLYNSEMQKNSADAGKATEETRGLKTKNDAMGQLGGLGQMFVRQPGETSDQYMQRVTPAFGTLIQAGGGNADDLARGLRSLYSTALETGDAADMTRGAVLNGQSPGKDFAPTPERADAIRTADAANSSNQAARVANIDQAGALGRVFAAPVTTAAGATTTLSPGDPRNRTMAPGSNGTIHGSPTLDSVRAGAGGQILALPPDQAPTSNLAAVFSGGATLPKPDAKAPAVVNGTVIDDVILHAAQSIPGATTTAANGKMSINQGFWDAVDPGLIAQGRTAAAATMQKTRNADAAAKAFLSVVKIAPGSTLGKTGGIFGFGGTPAIMPPEGAAPAQPAQPVASPMAPAPQAPPLAAPANVPPPQARPDKMRAQGKDGQWGTWDAKTQQWIADGQVN